MNKTKILLISTGVLIALAIVTGISYAVWLLTAEQTNQNILATECFDITFTEDTDSNINLQSTYPLLDSEGKELTPYTFSVTNTCDLNAKYQINLEVLNTTTLSHDLIKSMIDTKTPSIVTNNNIVTSTIANSTSYIIKTDYLAYNEINNHEFRMWIDESATLDNSQNKLVEAKIVISAEPIEEIPSYIDSVLAGNDPILDSKMIPVNIADTGVVTVADRSQEWYNYSNSEWANAVIVDPTFTTLDPGTTIPMESIEQMYVWIPRYEYKKSSIVNANESIEINFVPVSTVNTDIENNDVIVHPAFTFGTDELSGMWVGKFEQGEDNTIKPNQNSMHSMMISTLYDNINNVMNTYSMDETTDIHMMKNTEWGSIAYLSQSKYGVCNIDGTCDNKVENNNYKNISTYDIMTGCGGNDTAQDVSESGIEICPASNRWETANGIKASTTHNITGIYDMAGGRWEYMMGVMENSSGTFNNGTGGFATEPDSKYYDSYDYGTTYQDATAYQRGLYGDAIKELNPSGDSTPTNGLMANWNNDSAYFLAPSISWVARGGQVGDEASVGIFAFRHYAGSSYPESSVRAVGVVVQ